MVDDLRRKDGQHLIQEILFPEALVLFGQVLEVDAHIALLGQMLAQLYHDLVALLLQVGGLGHDGRQLLGGGEFGLVVGDLVFQQRAVIERTHPHHEKLVQIAAVDGSELHPLRQRNRFFLAQGQHAPVKIQPAQLPVDEYALTLGFHRQFPSSKIILRCRNSPATHPRRWY